MDFRIEDARIIDDAMVCSVVLGDDDGRGGLTGLITIKDVWVRSTKDKTKKFFKYPEKTRMKRAADGRYDVTNGEDGYPIRDPLVDTYLRDGKPTKQAFVFKDAVLAAITDTYNALAGENSGRGGATSAGRSRTAAPPAGFRTGAPAARGAAPAARSAAPAARRAPQELPAPVGGDGDEDELLF